MSEKDSNENATMEQEKLEEKERIGKRTIERMLAGAKEEQKRYDELQKARKELRRQLQVIFCYS